MIFKVSYNPGHSGFLSDDLCAGFSALFKYSPVFKGHTLPPPWCSGVPGGCVPRTAHPGQSVMAVPGVGTRALPLAAARAEMWQQSTQREHQLHCGGDDRELNPHLLLPGSAAAAEMLRLPPALAPAPARVGLVLRGSLSLRAALTPRFGGQSSGLCATSTAITSLGSGTACWGQHCCTSAPRVRRLRAGRGVLRASPGQPWEPGAGGLCASCQASLQPTLNLAAWEIRQKMLRLSVKASAVIWSEQMTRTRRRREMKAFRAGEH